MPNRVSSSSLNGSIHAVLTNRATQKDMKRLEAYIGRISAARAADLHHLREEVFGETLAYMVEKGLAMLARKGAPAMIRAATLAGIRAMRAYNAAPGMPTRTSRKPRRQRVAAEDVGRIADARAVELATVGEDDYRRLEFDRLASHAAADRLRQFEDRMEVDAILLRASASVATALRLIHLDGEPVGEAARQVGLDRFTLYRQITAFGEMWRAAA